MKLQLKSMTFPMLENNDFIKAIRRFVRNRGGVLGAITIFLFVLISLMAPWIVPYDPMGVNILDSLQPPSPSHLFGTDELGRDVFSRTIMGARYSLLLAVSGVFIALAIGVPMGLAAGYFGGLVDAAVMRVVDVMLAFPSILLAIVMINILGPGLINTMIAVGVSSVPTFARLARGSMLVVKELEYVTAAKAIGASSARVIFRHCLPNVSGPIIVQSTLRVSTMILTTAGLGFIGLGVQPPTPEWGAMMSEARAVLQVAPHAILFPGLAIMVVVVAFNLFGDSLTSSLDPRERDNMRF